MKLPKGNVREKMFDAKQALPRKADKDGLPAQPKLVAEAPERLKGPK